MADGFSLYIPEPPARPGDTPDFSHLQIPAAGAEARPDPTTPAEQLRDMAYGLVRVLDDGGKAVGPWAPTLTPEQLRHGLRAMALTRAVRRPHVQEPPPGQDQLLHEVHRRGSDRRGAVHGAGAARHVLSHLSGAVSWLMARDYPLIDLVNQIFSNERDPLKGRQLPILYSAREYGFYSLSGNLGSRFGHAVGWAMASRLQE